ncbi:hypothetical protein [uncultured Cytophaga sp.]|uniref:hypothetical protein n=1 Tax=uncultured Cytophaga sp. TaxID=160238 RepID=UPI002604B5B2|nr:hypothetical protein [uncultured Cytophaga sp.]
MLNYAKFILEKVSFDQQLFEKELIKHLSELIIEEVVELRNWCYEHFGGKYATVLNRCFA